MGKLNYTNRKIDGSKLASTVKKDLIKHVASSSKPRTVKDPHLDVNLQGKNLGDDELATICEGFSLALEAGAVKLDELNLAENNITLAGLALLSDVIRSSSKDLKELDLRGNALQVTSEGDIHVWETFLESFREVCCLRRLDISQNPLGEKAFEVLWRVYSRELPIHLPRVPRLAFSESSEDECEMDDVDDDSEDMEEIYNEARDLSLSDQAGSPSSFTSTAQSTQTPSRKAGGLNHQSSSYSLSASQLSYRVELRGLRSIPYMIVSDIAMSDTTALFLSYILPQHPLPERLMPYLPAPKAGHHTETLKQYENILGCSGVVYRPNTSETSMGKRVLESAEMVRDGRLAPSGEELSRSRLRRFSEASNPFHGSVRNRRESISTYAGIIGELERARSKIQSKMLRETGPNSVYLWKNAIRTLALSRTILFDPNAEPYESSIHTFLRHNSEKGHGQSPMSMSFSSSPISPMQHSIHSPSTPNSPSPFVSIPPRLSDVSTKNLAPPPPGLQFVQAQEYQPTIREGGPFPLSGEPGKESRDTGHKLPGNLTEEIWMEIIKILADPEGHLSLKQLRNIVDFAKTRGTLEQEREVAAKTTSVQVYRVLEATECLAYEGL